jgi:predicted kinase
MSDPITLALQKQYWVAPEQIEYLKKQVIVLESEAIGIKSVAQPKLIVVGGQPGSGKSDLQKYGELELNFNAVILSTDVLRSYHPFDQKIKQKHPEHYHALTVDLARTLLIHLENYALANQLNVILEATLANSEVMQQKIEKYRKHSYATELKVIAVNEMVSFLGAENRYESMILFEKSGRMVSKQNHDKNYTAIPDTLQQLQTQQLFDSVSVYQRKMFEAGNNVDTQVVLLEKNAVDFTKTYLNERNRSFTEIELNYLKQIAENVQAMKINRQANLLERTRFEAHFKEFLSNNEMKPFKNLLRNH